MILSLSEIERLSPVEMVAALAGLIAVDDDTWTQEHQDAADTLHDALTQALRESMEREAGLRESFDDAKGLLREHLSVFGHPGFTDRGSYADGIRAFFKRTALRTGGGE